MIVLRMNNGAVVKLLQVYLRGHGVWVRIHGSRGQMENMRDGDRNRIQFHRENYHEGDGKPEHQVYLPQFPEHHEAATRAGHGGGDFFMNFHFSQAIQRNEPPYFDVYRGVEASIVGILAYRSALNGSNTVEVPDLRQAAVRVRYADDHWNPEPARRTPRDPWPSVLGNVQPSAEALAYARKVWKGIGYEGE